MADRITRKDVERAFELFCKTVPAPEGERWILDHQFGPAFGLFTQRTDGSSYRYSDSAGLSMLGGTREALEKLHAMRRVAEYLQQREGR